jgi:hypothetical protein
MKLKQFEGRSLVSLQVKYTNLKKKEEKKRKEDEKRKEAREDEFNKRRKN